MTARFSASAAASPTRPETRYAKKGEWYVGYQVFGDGPLEIVIITNWSTNIEVMWEEPSLARFLERLASFARVVCYDRRGTGISDPVPLATLPTLEDWMDDVLVVMDAAEIERAAVIGDTEGGPMAMWLAATHPERVSALALMNTYARILRDDDYPVGIPARAAPSYIEGFERAWGTGALVELTAPSVAADRAFRRRFARYQRLSMPPRAASLMYEWGLHLDVRSVLANIQAPTLVLHRRDSRYYRIAYGRYLSEHIPGASLVELPGADCYPFHVGDVGPVLDELHAFLTGVREVPWQQRVLATVLFTDVVASTELAIGLGDERWLDLRAAHYAVVRRLLDRYEGREIDTTGDGFLATFDGPARAIRCAVEIAAGVRDLGIEIRAGLHTGEVELRDGGVGGVAVHIGSRVLSLAPAGGVLVSGTVRDLVVGSGIEFALHGVHRLKGVPGEWTLYSVQAVP